MALGKADKEFLIRVKADIQAAVGDMRDLTKELDRQGRAAGDASKRMGLAGNALQSLKAAAAAYLGVATAIRSIRLAEEYQNIQVRLERVTRAQGDYNRVSREVYQISQQNGVALRDTAGLFVNINRAARDLGATRDQVLAVTNAIQQLGVLSGSTDAELGNALRQFGQAMAGGVVRAEEFNSIIENTPELASRIAKGMDLTVGQLRLAVVEGNVLSRDVFRSLLKQTGEIATEAAQMPETLARSAQRLENAWSRFLDQANRSLNIVGSQASLTQEWAFFLDDITRRMDSATDSGEQLNQQSERQVELKREEAHRLAVIARLEEQAAKFEAKRGKSSTVIARAIEIQQRKLEAIRGDLESLAGPGGDTNAPPPIEPPPSPEEKSRQRRIGTIIAGLKQQAETYGQTAEQIAVYRLEVEKAAPDEIKLAQALANRITAQREAEQATRDAIRTEEEAQRQRERENEELDRQAQHWRDLVNPINVYQRQLEEVERLYDSGRIAAETYAEATLHIMDAMEQVGEKAEETGNEMDQFAVQAARNIQTELGDTLYNIAKGNFDNILSAWADMLAQMASQALAAQLGKKLFGADFGNTGDIGGIVGDVLGSFGLFHSGGIVGQSSGMSRQVHPAAFINAPRYHTGGFPGLTPEEVPIIAKRREEVLSEHDPRNALNGGMQGGGNRTRIVNVIDPALVQDYLSSASGEDVILNLISRRRGDVQSILS